tara:strand:+ start:46 stop:273 length:228 start_codon:yes stop_codon:yes gene_type:complete
MMESLEIIANELGLTIGKTPAEYGVPKGYALYYKESGDFADDLYGGDGRNLKEIAELLAMGIKHHYTQTKKFGEL